MLFKGHNIVPEEEEMAQLVEELLYNRVLASLVAQSPHTEPSPNFTCSYIIREKYDLQNIVPCKLLLSTLDEFEL